MKLNNHEFEKWWREPGEALYTNNVSYVKDNFVEQAKLVAQEVGELENEVGELKRIIADVHHITS